MVEFRWCVRAATSRSYSIGMFVSLVVHVLVICTITNAQQCLSGRNIELSVDGQLVTTTLHKPIGSSFVVRCRRCNNNRRPPWFKSRTEISASCSVGVPICTKNADKDQAKDLIFSSFTESLEGEYRCSRSGRDGIINIKTFGPPQITAHPTGGDVPMRRSITLMCRASGLGTLVYSWEKKSNRRWTVISSDNTTEFSVTQNGRYRCNVSNEAGSVVSKSATVNVYGPPVITDHPTGGGKVLTGRSITLMCRASGLGTLVYSWERSSGSSWTTVSNGNTISYTTNTTLTIGEYMYRCNVSNEAGSVVSYTANVVVCDIFPHILTHPTDTSAAAPFSGVFTCSVTGCGHLNITWYRRGGSLPTKSESTEVSSPTVTTSTLVIPNVTSDDVGRYYCIVWANGRALRSNNSILSFSGTPPHVRVVISNPLLHLQTSNQKLSLNCIPDTKGVNYTWEKKYSTLTSRAQRVNTSNMIIVNIKPEDSGEYRCIISNNTGRIFSDYASATVKVIPPKIVQPPFSVLSNISSTIIFSCSGKGYGQKQVTWHKDGLLKLPPNVVVNISESLDEITGFLKVYEIIGYYKGYYYCSINNTAGRVNSVRAYLNITVPPPDIVRPPHSLSLRPGNSAFFECLAWSYSGVAYDWYKRNASNFTTNAVMSYNRWSEGGNCISTIYTLTISNVQPLDEDWYCCVAINDYGSVEECAWLEINTTANITVQPLSKTYRSMEENLCTLKCEAVGMGPISYKWEKYQPSNDSWIRPSDRAINITSTKLIFTVIIEEDEGIYHCVVTNDDGSVVSDNATIIVYGPPIINYISSSQVILEGNKISLTCNATNDKDAVNSLVIIWYKTKDKPINITQQDHIIEMNTMNITTILQSTILFDPIHNTDDGEYTCQVFNHPKSYTKMKTHVTVQFAPIVTIDPPQSTRTVFVNDSLRLLCTAKGKPVPDILWYEDSDPSIQSLPQLYLVPTTTPHTTNYTCFATSNVGGKLLHDSASIIVIVKEKKVCPPLNKPEFGKLYIDGSRAIFTCCTGYYIDGNQVVTCIDGEWSSPEPKCISVDQIED